MDGANSDSSLRLQAIASQNRRSHRLVSSPHACMRDVLILFLYLIVTVVRLAESVVAPNAPGNVGESVIENAA